MLKRYLYRPQKYALHISLLIIKKYLNNGTKYYNQWRIVHRKW